MYAPLPVGEASQLPDLVKDLQSLNNQYGPTTRMVYGHLVSNDRDYENIGSDVMMSLPEEESGVGIFIGGGSRGS